MPDPYASIAQADETLQARLADVLEVRAADPQQRAMLDGSRPIACFAPTGGSPCSTAIT
jgi:hypothetical protein